MASAASIRSIVGETSPQLRELALQLRRPIFGLLPPARLLLALLLGCLPPARFLITLLLGR
jgi:hypothetical protein